MAEDLPFAGDTFDTVVCTFPAGYILERCTWAEFYRILSPGGRVVVVYGASAGGTSLVQRFSRGLLSLGQVRVQRPQPDTAGLERQHVIVEEGGDRIGLLLAKK